MLDFSSIIGIVAASSAAFGALIGSAIAAIILLYRIRHRNIQSNLSSIHKPMTEILDIESGSNLSIRSSISTTDGNTYGARSNDSTSINSKVGFTSNNNCVQDMSQNVSNWNESFGASSDLSVCTDSNLRQPYIRYPDDLRHCTSDKILRENSCRGRRQDARDGHCTSIRSRNGVPNNISRHSQIRNLSRDPNDVSRHPQTRNLSRDPNHVSRHPQTRNLSRDHSHESHHPQTRNLSRDNSNLNNEKYDERRLYRHSQSNRRRFHRTASQVSSTRAQKATAIAESILKSRTLETQEKFSQPIFKRQMCRYQDSSDWKNRSKYKSIDIHNQQTIVKSN